MFHSETVWNPVAWSLDKIREGGGSVHSRDTGERNARRERFTFSTYVVCTSQQVRRAASSASPGRGISETRSRRVDPSKAPGRFYVWMVQRGSSRQSGADSRNTIQYSTPPLLGAISEGKELIGDLTAFSLHLLGRMMWSSPVSVDSSHRRCTRNTLTRLAFLNPALSGIGDETTLTKSQDELFRTLLSPIT